MKRLLFFFGVMLLMILITGCAQPNEPEEETEIEYLELVEVYETEAYTEDFQVTDNYIYIAEDMAGFSIWEQSTGDMLCRFDSTLISNVRDIRALEGNELLLIYNKNAGTSSGVCFFDISDLTKPRYLQTHVGNISDIVDLKAWTIDEHRFRFSYGYGGSAYYTGEFIDEGSPIWYQDINTFEDINLYFSPESYQEDRENNRLYFAAGEMGVIMMDSSDYSEIGRISTIGQTLAVKVVDNVTFLCNREEGIQLFDISNPSSPEEIYSYNTTGLASEVEVSKELNVFAIASTSGGIYLFQGPEGEIKRLQRVSQSEIGYTYQVRLHGEYLYAGTRYGVYKFKIKNI